MYKFFTKRTFNSPLSLNARTFLFRLGSCCYQYLRYQPKRKKNPIVVVVWFFIPSFAREHPSPCPPPHDTQSAIKPFIFFLQQGKKGRKKEKTDILSYRRQPYSGPEEDLPCLCPFIGKLEADLCAPPQENTFIHTLYSFCFPPSHLFFPPSGLGLDVCSASMAWKS